MLQLKFFRIEGVVSSNLCYLQSITVIPTFATTSHSDWPGVHKYESKQGLNLNHQINTFSFKLIGMINFPFKHTDTISRDCY